MQLMEIKQVMQVLQVLQVMQVLQDMQVFQLFRDVIHKEIKLVESLNNDFNSCTQDINKGRGGRELYLCWRY